MRTRHYLKLQSCMNWMSGVKVKWKAVWVCKRTFKKTLRRSLKMWKFGALKMKGKMGLGAWFQTEGVTSSELRKYFNFFFKAPCWKSYIEIIQYAGVNIFCMKSWINHFFTTYLEAILTSSVERSHKTSVESWNSMQLSLLREADTK